MSRSKFQGMTDVSETQNALNKISEISTDSVINSSVFNLKVQEDPNVTYLPLECLEDAPSEWNFYKPLNDNKMTELIESIEKNGLINPVIVWEKEESSLSNPKYMILSGHNRVKAYKMLLSITNNVEYNKIAAIVKGKNDITEDEAKEIIIDTNWVQRQLSGVEKAQSIIRKYALLQKKYSKNERQGRLRDVIAKEYNITGRQIDNYRNLENLIEEIQMMVFNNEISITAGCEAAKLKKEIQKWIYDNYPEKINTSYIRKIKADMEIDDVKKIFEESEEQKSDISFKASISLELYEKYKKLPNKDKDVLNKKIEANIIKLIDKYLKNKQAL